MRDGKDITADEAPQELYWPKTYVRYFRIDEANAADYGSQLVACEDYAWSAGLASGETHGPIVDLCPSGSAPEERPGLSGLLEAARSGAFEVVILSTLDMLSGDHRAVARVQGSLAAFGAEIHLAGHGPLEMNRTAFDEMTARVRAERRSMLISLGQQRFRAAGRYKGPTPYAYTKTSTPGVLAIRQPQATNTHGLYVDFADGVAANAIARSLSDAGIPPPSGTRWTAALVLALLRNPIHAGFMVYGRRPADKVMRDGSRQRARRSQPPSAWICIEVPHLRIVELPLWREVAAQLGVKVPPAMSGTVR